MALIHANSLQIADRGLLIVGRSGTGKSAISLELIDRARFSNKRAALIADDFSEITERDQHLIAKAPTELKGLIEIRGAGIYHIAHNDSVVLTHAVTLGEASVRFPENYFYNLNDVKLPMIKLPAVENADCITICHAIEAFLFRNRLK